MEKKLLFVLLILAAWPRIKAQNTQTCRNVSYNVEHLNQTNNCCQNGMKQDRSTEDVNNRISALEKKVQELQRKQNQTATSCPVRYTVRYQSSCYRFVKTSLDWMEAFLTCHFDGGHLVAMETLEEYNYLKTYIKNENSLKGQWGLFISGTDFESDGDWNWASVRKPISYTNWASGEPNGGSGEKCLIIYKTGDWLWADYGCHNKLWFICEISL